MTTGEINRAPLPDVVAAQLRDDIMSGALEPGQRLILQVLADRFGVSHIPVREALRKLEGEALVQSRPSHGVVVSALNIDELQDLYRLRRLLEVDAIRRGFDDLTQAAISRSEELLDTLIAEKPHPEDGRWWSIHRSYHWSFFEPGLTPWFRRVLQLVWQNSERYQRLFVLVYGSAEHANQMHRQFLLHARTGDRDALITAWLEHMEWTEETIISGYRDRHRAGDGSAPA